MHGQRGRLERFTLRLQGCRVHPEHASLCERSVGGEDRGPDLRLRVHVGILNDVRLPARGHALQRLFKRRLGSVSDRITRVVGGDVGPEPVPDMGAEVVRFPRPRPGSKFSGVAVLVEVGVDTAGIVV